MGCILSSFDEDENVGICKERKKLIKQLVSIRGEFSDSLLAYLKALRNTGGTLRQFTESEILEFDSTYNGVAGPPSPRTHLPTSPVRPPPPLPPLVADEVTPQVAQEVTSEDVCNNVPPMQNDAGMGSWIFSTEVQNFEIVESAEDENWEETKTEFEDEDQEPEVVLSGVRSRSGKQPVDDNTSTRSLFGKEGTDMPVVEVKRTRREKTLEAIGTELDEFFLKASACVKEIAILIDVSGGDTLLRSNSGHLDGKSGNSAKVFSILSRSRHRARDAAESFGPSEPCKPGAHCATLKKLHAAEKKLFKAVKEEVIVKLEFERKSLLLQKQENENIDWMKTDKTRSNVENLNSHLLDLRQLITETTSSILYLIDEELLPQLVALTAGLIKMWRTMNKCHQAQTLICQQLSNLSDNQNVLQNTEDHHRATIQFQTEASYWYSSFCKLVKSQREYVRTLCRWIQLTKCLWDGHESSDNSSLIHSICQQWELGLDRLPDKDASDAIKGLLSSIHSIIDQQAQEDNILKRLNKLKMRWRRCSESLSEMEEKFKYTFENEDIPVNMSPMHPLSLKRNKTEALKKEVDRMTATYMGAVQCSRTMTLNHLKTRLPQLFQSLMEFSNASAEAIEGIQNPVEQVESTDTTASQN
ncbi:protein ALTERED PHOSPHATE STARVATION RESPONSE 1 isoform X1 [Arachis duranensis]|uniref:Protein ALTERED PHOSPHATE STARVATION RESPONSE 1 isoform X1 n=2 Tax=Arachis duranensis TaxID=130453 RepID=A0A9C6WGJ5_ARADU|nr:protein ALTERED PHOSPHATE STARVATION RESPONSE 1 isoform X1 [Arachis duranensis]XP_052114708.1 protein ALTERED PHOSPHATE STARVATION RESPONSE 1 isoform X1 [Arachis duranensis]XP_052114709.1 protein ALTERED PHOSPHATE STARVATION RESPONSE 1 isoform X1 [Arachis duranensis]